MKKQKVKKDKGRLIKNNVRGITLIALVITIVVLLILASVSIATLTGENGILTRLNEAKIETEEAKEDELIQSYDNYDITTEDMQVAHDTLEQTLEEEQTQQQVQTNENEGR